MDRGQQQWKDAMGKLDEIGTLANRDHSDVDDNIQVTSRINYNFAKIRKISQESFSHCSDFLNAFDYRGTPEEHG